MAVIRIPYEYRSFRDAPITTWIEKRIQGSAVFLFFLGTFTVLPLIIGISLLSRGMEDTIWEDISMICSLAILVLWFVFPFIFRAVWNRTKIAEKMALLEAASKTDPALKRSFRKYFARFIGAFLIPMVFVGCCYVINSVRPIIYDRQMQSAFVEGFQTEHYGEKCTVYMVEDDLYSGDLLPAPMRASSPKQVGYILLLSENEYLAGYTLDYNYFTKEGKEIPVYMYSCTVEWISCASGTVVKTQTIEGSKPTTDSPLIDGAYYGKSPLGTFIFEDAIEDAYEELTSQ